MSSFTKKWKLLKVMLINFILSFYNVYIYPKRMSYTFHKHVRYTSIPIKRNMYIKINIYIYMNLDNACKYNILWSVLNTIWRVYFQLCSQLEGFILLCVFLCVILSYLCTFVLITLTYPKAFSKFPCVNFPQSQFISCRKLLSAFVDL